MFHSEIGKNNVSNGYFIKTASILEVALNKKNYISGGVQIDIKNDFDQKFTGSFIMYSRNFSIKKFHFGMDGFYMYNPFSKLFYETNWGIIFKTQRKHFIYKLGTSFRKYSISRKAINDNNIKGNTQISENWNIMYLLQYNLKPIRNKWNIGVSLTNIDYFIINQETNPVIYMQAKYKFNKPLTVFLEVWHKSAGSLNISVNHFGYLIRSKLLWNIN